MKLRIGVFLAISMFLGVFCPNLIFAEIVILKTGQKINGKIIERSDDHIKLDLEGVILTYYSEEIEKIEEENPPSTPRQVVPQETVFLSPVGNLSNNSSDKFLFRLHLPEAKTYKVRDIMEKKTSVAAEGMDLSSIETQGTGFIYNVEKVDDEGNMHIKATCDWILLKKDGPGGKGEYDSSSSSSEVPEWARLNSYMLGQSLYMVITPEGKTKEFSGFEEMFKNILEKASVPEGPKKTLLEMLIKQISTALKDSMAKKFAVFPARPIGVGDSWKSSGKSNILMPVSLDTTYTLKERKDGIAFFEINTNMNFDSSMSSKMGMKTGEGTGTMDIEESSGWVIRMQTTQKFSGFINEASGKQPVEFSGVVTTTMTSE